jgi:RimJ/RimL family protein N-acetyltransferase
VRGVCRWGFAELGLARVLAFKGEAVAGNTASWRVVEKLGFVREGTLRAFLVQRGVRKDAWTGSLLRGEAGREGTE